MVTKPMPPGRIIFTCSRCGLVLYYYALGENVNEKYAGIPGVGRVNKLHGGRCPRCGAPLSIRPLRVEILTRREYEESNTIKMEARRGEAVSAAGDD